MRDVGERARAHRRATIASRSVEGAKSIGHAPDRRPRVRARRRHRRVRHAGRRRQGQGAQGGRRARHRLRRRRARLPDARPHRRGRGRGLPRPEEPPVHARPAACPSCKEAIAAKTLRDSGLRGRRRARCWSPTAASTPSTTPSPRCSTRATRCCSRRRTGPPTPSRSRWPAASPVELPTDETTRLPGHRRPARGGPHRRAPRRCVFVSPSNPTGAVYPRGRGRGHRPLGGRARHLGASPTRSTSTSPTATTSSPRCRRSCPSWPTAASSLNGVAKTYAMTGWRVGLDDRPARRRSRRPPTCSPTPRRTSPTSRQRAALAAVSRRPRRRRRDARRLRPARPDDAPAAQRHRGRHLPRARRARSTPSRTSTGVLGRDDPRPHGRRPRSSWPT